MYQRILIPTDGSPGTDSAVEHALDLAERYDAALYALYVVDTDALPLDRHAQRLVESVTEEGTQSVEGIAERAADLGIDPVVSEIREGSPHEIILQYLADNDIDLIVMGTHGRRGLGRNLLGSVTERVVRTSDVPVLTVRMDGSPEEAKTDG